MNPRRILGNYYEEAQLVLRRTRRLPQAAPPKTKVQGVLFSAMSTFTFGWASTPRTTKPIQATTTTVMMTVNRLIPPVVEYTTTRNALLIAFTLMGSYCISANMAIAIHEFGHGVGMRLGGGSFFGLFLAPQGYSGSYVARDFPISFATTYGRLLQVAGGPILGAAFGLVLFIIARFFKWGTVGWIVVYGTGTWCIGNNGAYLFLGSFYRFGDALDLTELGIPRWGLFLIGLPLTVAFLPSFASFLVGIGLKLSDAYWRWVFVIEGGLLGYLSMIFGLRLLYPTHGLLPPTSNDLFGLAFGPVVLFLIASCTYAFRHAGHKYESSTAEPGWTKAGVIFALGLLLIASEFLFFSYDYEAFAEEPPAPPKAAGKQVGLATPGTQMQKRTSRGRPAAGE